MALYSEEELLIVAKTYPTPSTKYRETTCVGAISADGQVRRLYPVPFRLLEGTQQFRKWEWIRARVSTRRADRRPESRHIDPDSLTRLRFMRAGAGWPARMSWVEPHIVPSFMELEKRREESGHTMGFVRPHRLVELEIKPDSEPEWTDKEWANLRRLGLFDSPSSQVRPPLRKLPYGFRYRYTCLLPDGSEQECDHMITDWEVGALFWNCRRSHGAAWETPFRRKMEVDLTQRDLVFFMGTVHRFPSTWVIAGVLSPPPAQPPVQPELALFGE